MIYEITDLTDPLLDLISGDPVRPEIPVEQRVGANARVLVLISLDNREPQSVVCISFLNSIPTTVQQLFDPVAENPRIATLYTIWSLQPGGGQAMVLEARSWIQEHWPSVKRIVTLSPPTAMARRFHLKNGATELQVNPETVNFEYALI